MKHSGWAERVCGTEGWKCVGEGEKESCTSQMSMILGQITVDVRRYLKCSQLPEANFGILCFCNPGISYICTLHM